MLKAATELSFILKKDTRSYNDEDGDYSTDLWMEYDDALNLIRAKALESSYAEIFKLWDVKFKQDQLSIEVNHAPSKTLDVYQLYKYIYLLAKDCGLVPQHNFVRKGVKYYTPTGGGHIHVEVPFLEFSRGAFFEDFAAFEKSLINTISNRPYLLWLFAEPFDEDMENFSNHNNNYKERSVHQITVDHPVVPRYRSIRHKGVLPTVEYRMVGNAPISASAADRNLKIFTYLTNHCANHKEPFTLTKDRYDRFKKDPKFILDDFGALLKDIAFTPKSGERFDDLISNYFARKNFKNFR